jgi:hypothetical protein
LNGDDFERVARHPLFVATAGGPDTASFYLKSLKEGLHDDAIGYYHMFDDLAHLIQPLGSFVYMCQNANVGACSECVDFIEDWRFIMLPKQNLK